MVKYQLMNGQDAGYQPKIVPVVPPKSLGNNVKDTGSLPSSRNIPQKVKAQFICLITREGYSLKNASKALNLSYSTSKKIFARFRRSLKSKRQSKIEEGKTQAEYREVSRSEASQVIAIPMIAGQLLNP